MKTYAIVGAGSRCLGMYAEPLGQDFADRARVVGVCDPNPVRARLIAQAANCPDIYDDFDEMLKKAKPDAVIITTVDQYHDGYIIKALEAGVEAITEKPMTTDDAKCRAILEAERRTGGKVTVTFNARFTPFTTRIKELLRQGAVGRIYNVDFEWLLDTSHGADYFRRWHRNLDNSGGLMVHKATHHFDMINWWIEQDPQTISAQGALNFYGPTRQERSERCLTCPYKKTCAFYLDIAADPGLKALYLDAEAVDGYFRDRCVFSEKIDIYDTMSVQVKYDQGAFLTYSLVAFSPYEGWKLAITGEKGRLEAQTFLSGRKRGEPDDIVTLYNHRGEAQTLAVPKHEGVHGGSDARLREMLFGGFDEDPLGYMAGTRDGAMSILIGIGANRSIKEKRQISVKEMLEGTR